jgi:hypothetical protein
MKKAAVPSILIAVVLLAVTVIAEAQQPKKVARIVYLVSSDPITESSRSEEFGRLCVKSLSSSFHFSRIHDAILLIDRQCLGVDSKTCAPPLETRSLLFESCCVWLELEIMYLLWVFYGVMDRETNSLQPNRISCMKGR